MNQQVQYGGIEIPYAVKQEGMGTSPVNMGYSSPPEATTSGTQHKMTILELRENQEIMQQQQLTGQQQWQHQQQQIPMFQIQQQQGMLYPATTTNKLRLSASPSGGGCIPVDVNDGSDSYIPRHQQQPQLQLSTVSENGDATIDELFNADNGSDGVEIYCGGGGGGGGG